MAEIVPLQRRWARGMRRDSPRDQMPEGSSWNLVDLIPEAIGSPLRKRGGWSHGSDALAAGSYVAATAFADFTDGSELVEINDAGTLYSINLSTQADTSIGAAVVPIAHPVLHRDLLVIPGNNGATAPKSYSAAGVLAALSGTAPNGIYPTVYKDRTVLANVSGNEQRVYFGPDGAPSGTWDTTNSYLDASFPVKGLFSLRNAILVFGNGRTERIRGSTPPPNTDMVKEPLFQIGCLDARTIVGYGDNVIFANQEGVWMTDGAVPENLCQTGGIYTYWNETLSAYASTWTLAAGVVRGFYVISIMDGATFKDCLVCNIDARTWFRLTNVKSLMFAKSLGAAEELYFGRRDTPRAGKLSTIFTPSSSVLNDADATAVTWTWETPYYLGSPAKKRLNTLYLTGYMLAATTAPTIQPAYITSPEATSYTNLSTTFGEQTGLERVPIPVRLSQRGFAFKFTQAVASDDTRIDALEATVHEWEKSR